MLKTKPLCFGPKSRAMIRTDRVWDKGLSGKPGNTQANDEQAKDLSDCRLRSRVGNQLFALNPEQEESSLICDKLRSERRWGIRSEDQRGNGSKIVRATGQ